MVLPWSSPPTETLVNTQEIDLKTWIGRRETVVDAFGPTPVRALAATLDHPAALISPGTPLPPLWHWLYFLPMHRQFWRGLDAEFDRIALDAQDLHDDATVDDDAFVEFAGEDEHEIYG